MKTTQEVAQETTKQGTMETTQEVTQKTINLKPAIWFSRHKPTDIHIEHAANLGYAFVELDLVSELGGKIIDNPVTLKETLETIKALPIEALFCISLPVPLQAKACKGLGTIQCYASWRAPEINTEKPHVKWLRHTCFKTVGTL